MWYINCLVRLMLTYTLVQYIYNWMSHEWEGRSAARLSPSNLSFGIFWFFFDLLLSECDSLRACAAGHFVNFEVWFNDRNFVLRFFCRLKMCCRACFCCVCNVWRVAYNKLTTFVIFIVWWAEEHVSQILNKPLLDLFGSQNIVFLLLFSLRRGRIWSFEEALLLC